MTPMRALRVEIRLARSASGAVVRAGPARRCSRRRSLAEASSVATPFMCTLSVVFVVVFRLTPSPDADVAEAQRLQTLGVVHVPPVDDQGLAQELLHFLEVQLLELVPLREDR